MRPAAIPRRPPAACQHIALAGWALAGWSLAALASQRCAPAPTGAVEAELGSSLDAGSAAPSRRRGAAGAPSGELGVGRVDAAAPSGPPDPAPGSAARPDAGRPPLASGGGDAAAPSEPNGAAEPPPRVELGLEQRPANPSCAARPPPTDLAGDPFPQRLSETGCMNATDPSRAGPGLIPYEVNMPLWSDGADKQRWMALPEGETIEVQADGHWEFPVGSVLVKAFALGGAPVETRLLMRHADGSWGGYSYAWQEGSGDATLLPTATRRVFGGQEWSYPSRDNCAQCHGEAAGRTLGPKTAQLNRLASYPRGIAPQLETLSAIGVLSRPLSSEQEAALPAPEPFAAGSPPSQPPSTVELSRAYLDVNCSHCHRPGGVPEVAFDLRFDTPLEAMRICDVPPSRGNFGLFGARLLLPGDPLFSLISVRMHSTIATVRMPQIGTARVDERATAWIDAWIEGMPSCEP